MNTLDGLNVLSMSGLSPYYRAQYKPFISYSWSTLSIASDGIRKLNDSGSTPKYHAESYFGRGVLFNGIDQVITAEPSTASTNGRYTISFQSNHISGNGYITKTADVVYKIIWVSSGQLTLYSTSHSKNIYTGINITNRDVNVSFVFDGSLLLVYINGVQEFSYDDGLQFGEWKNSSELINTNGLYNGILSNITTIINQSLTPQQIKYQYDNPERFLYREEGLGNDVIRNGDFSTDSDWVHNVINENTYTEIVNGKAHIVSDGTYVTLTQSGIEIGKTYEITVDCEIVSGSVFMYISGSSNELSAGTNTFTLDAGNTYIGFKRGSACDVYLDNVSIKEVKPILKSQILTQAEIDNVVAYLPMCENDGYVRDYVGYSETSIYESDFSTIDGWYSSFGTISTDGVTLSIQGDGGGYTSLARHFTVTQGKSYLINIDATETDAISFGDGTTYNAYASQIEVSNYIMVATNSDTLTVTLHTNDNTVSAYRELQGFTVTELTSTYPIQNYTTSCNAKNLQSGLQTCFWKRDLLGVPYASSFNALECDGVGYVDTGWIPNNGEDWQIEYVLEFKGNSSYNFSGTYVSTSDRLQFGENNNGNARLLVNGGSVSSVVGVGFNHLLIVKSGTTFELFVNGVSAGSTIQTLVNTISLRLNETYSTSFIMEENSIPLFKVHTTPQDPLELYNKWIGA